MHALRHKSRRKWLWIPVLLILLAILAAFAVERNLTQIVLSLAQAQARALAVKALNEAADEIVLSGVTYDQLMAVTLDQSGQVRLIQANTPEMNLLASRASLTAQKKLAVLEEQAVPAPLGSAVRLALFAGSGPRIQVEILPVGSVRAEFTTEFESVGINQSRHKVSLTLTAQVQLVIPTGASTVQAVTQVAVAESIIVGEVPDAYTDVDEDMDMLDLAP